MNAELRKLPTTVEVLTLMNEALDKKTQCLYEIYNYTVYLMNAEFELETAKNKVINEYNDLTKHPEGQKELGSNESARNATIDKLVANEIQEVHEFELKLLHAKFGLSKAQVEEDKQKYTLRLLEVEVGKTHE